MLCFGIQIITHTPQVITDDTFSRHEGFDLATFEDKNWPPSELPSFRVLKQEPYSVFKSRVALHFNLPEAQIRLWVLVNRQNKTVRPDTHIPENEPTLSKRILLLILHCPISHTSPTAVEVIRNNMAARQNDLRLYLDVINTPSVCVLLWAQALAADEYLLARSSTSNYYDLPETL